MMATFVLGCATGCAHAQSSYQQCLDHPAEWGEGTSRTGGWSKHLGMQLSDWGGHDSYAERLVITERIEHCKHIVTVQSDGGTFESRPYGYVDQYASDTRGRRYAFVGSDAKAYVVIDGVESQPWDEVIWPPRFSTNGHHVAYLARDERGGAAVVDGKSVMRAFGFESDNFELLDDGRVAAVRRFADGHVDVAFGGHNSARLDEIGELSFVISASGRLAFVGRSRNRWRAFVDLEAVDAPGVPIGYEVFFSLDGSRYAYATIAHHRRGDGSDDKSYAVVVDGTVIATADDSRIARVGDELTILSHSVDPLESPLLVVVSDILSL